MRLMATPVYKLTLQKENIIRVNPFGDVENVVTTTIICANTSVRL